MRQHAVRMAKVFLRDGLEQMSWYFLLWDEWEGIDPLKDQVKRA